MFGDGVMATRYLPHVVTNNCAVPRKAFLSIGGFDESLPRYGFEDVDLSWRMQEAGYRLVYSPDAIVYFTVSDSVASIRKKFALGRGRVLMAVRYPAYDSTDYTFPRTLRDLAQACSLFIRTCMSSRRIDRAHASSLVALAGRVVGSVQYRGGRHRARRYRGAGCHPAAHK